VSRAGWAGQCFFCNPGRKRTRRRSLARLNGRPGRYKIVTMINSFHGRTYAPVSHGPASITRVEPMLAGFSYAPFGDLNAVAKLIDARRAA
jgi:acetylornithine/succinyldiaminopimelate/putrescine aminotransferase